MREIKFRAWIHKLYKICVVESIDFFGGRISYVDTNCEEYYSNTQFNKIELMQFTGVKDSNGKEIYEGDILSNDERYYTVVFENGSFRAEFERDFEEYSFDLIDVVAQGCEIVGNIYKNPEIFRKGKVK